MGAVTDSVGVNNAQTSATDANEVLSTLEQPLSPTSTTIHTSQKVSSASSPLNVQMEIQYTPIYLDTRENYTSHHEFDISDAIESSLTLQLQNTTSPTPDSWIYFFTKTLTDENCNFAMAASVNGYVRPSMRRQFCQLMLKNGKLQCKLNSKVL